MPVFERRTNRIQPLKTDCILFIDVLPLGNHVVTLVNMHTNMHTFARRHGEYNMYALQSAYTPFTVLAVCSVRACPFKYAVFYVFVHKMSPVSNHFATMYQLRDVYLVCGIVRPGAFVLCCSIVYIQALENALESIKYMLI